MATEVGALPDDALANVFRGLPLRSLAVVRCVCKAWRDLVGAREFLLRHLLPLTVRGVFINYKYHDHPHHFARPCSPSSSTIPRVDGTLSFLPEGRRRSVSVLDHCNGLLLCGDTGLGVGELCVCNPATRRWTVLPRWWEEDDADDDKRRHRYAGAYIAFDPAESPRYEVILVPAVPEVPSPPPEDDDHRWSAAEVRRRALLWEEEKDAPFCLDWFFSLPEDGGGGTAVGQWEFQELPSSDLQQYRGYMEWPPAPWKLRVFSSRTGQWEDRIFVRDGMLAGKVYKMRSDLDRRRRLWRYAVYHHGSLYVHCGSFVARISLSKSKYQIIESPANVNEYTKPYYVNEYTKPYLGILQNGVCFGIVQDHQLTIWILNESCGQMEWVLKYETVVGHYAKYLGSIHYDHDGSWIVEENVEMHDTDHDVESLSEEENIEIQDIDHDDESLESLSDEGNIEIQDSDHDVESPSEEENIDHDVESVSEEENTEIRDTNHDVESTDHHVESLSEEENTKIRDTDHDVESLSEEGHEWDSDNDDTVTIKTECQKYFYNGEYLNIIGFHPYKEVVFMVLQFHVVAYHLNSTKIQYLGNSRPKSCKIFWNPIYESSSFLYTPCMIGDLLHGDQTGGQTSSED